MFGSMSLVESRERAAVLALMTRGVMPWNRLAGAIEEEGSALRLLQELEPDAEGQLFSVEGEKYPLDRMEDYLHRLEAEGIDVVTVLDAVYPDNLRMVYDRPPALFMRGEPDDADERSVAVVGTRAASPEGIKQAEAIVAALVAADYVIVSGLAAGIDTSAHRAALAAGARTVAVIGTGLRHAFPEENADLQTEIARKHAVISQFWPGQGPRRWTFPQRNAVMSGFARATAVVEASHTSGARMQARLASEHGRPVFLLRSLLSHRWAQGAAERPGTYVVDEGAEVVDHLARLYDSPVLVAD
jgi:DNA processing protein